MPDNSSVKARVKSLAAKGKRLKSRFDESHPGRMMVRYGDRNGNVLAGGIAYYSLISIAAGLVIGATIVSMLADYIPGVREAVFDVLSDTVPGVVGQGDDALVSESDKLATPVTGLVGLLALFLGANRAARFIGGLRAATVSMLGREGGNPFQGKLRDFIALVGIALIALTGIVVQVIASRAAEWIVGLIGDGTVSEWLLRAPALLVGLVIDMLFVAMVLVVLGRARGSRRKVMPVLFATAVVIGILRLASSALVGSAADNPVLGPIAAVITLLIFVDFTTRAILMAAAWLGAQRVHVTEPAASAPLKVRTRVGRRGRKPRVTTRRATVRTPA
ncbi:YihY/virulence factor BrkB family protein [Demequina sp. TTPB684]|uniref:YihY/virulence factor BrkB family protein n=1 Tax=unclassified Demequina TaxID=2620311 RepID=UPI001CF39278|nr:MULTISPECIES: YihY/virulence factor BrkB family protein [unclassified Demequina]MCB2411407.1 YihY/virulence factor BrkB family protein [Demequina sp. TTPB684]UPU87282.1 YihY/virulence factor BrkB family protein [Demequina sp. TMPB413]